jgi:16S rRNA (guanine966-N2)-methyltransferase
MNVIAGSLKGRKLNFVKNKNVRPLTQKVKEAMFSVLQDWIVEKNILDLFCGSGSMAIEAISRGASHADLVDLSVGMAVQNVKALGIEEYADIFRKDVLLALKLIHSKEKSYDFIFVGAPYGFPKTGKVLETIDEHRVLRKGGYLMLERPNHREFPSEFESFAEKKQYRYGQTVIVLYESIL